MNDVWKDLENELIKCNQSSMKPCFWIRDDDSAKDGPKLRKLVNITKKYNVPLSLAVIPYEIEKDLIELTQSYNRISVLQHGFKHKNHEPKGQKKSEFGQHREIKLMKEDIEKGYKLIKKSFLKNAEPVFVPPWNRMSDKLLPYLFDIGIQGVSTINQNTINKNIYKKIPIIINTNVDIIDWNNNKIFLGQDKSVKKILAELKKRRNNKTRNNIPIGLLTHHIVMNKDAFLFLENLFHWTKKNGAQWNSIKDIMTQMK